MLLLLFFFFDVFEDASALTTRTWSVASSILPGLAARMAPSYAYSAAPVPSRRIPVVENAATCCSSLRSSVP